MSGREDRSSADLPPRGSFADCWFLTGPTASGKTRLALELARRLNCEIVAMDSMTLYRGMDVGTAKPTAPERARVAHHLIDVLEPTEPASVDWYLRHASKARAEIRSRGRQPLFVGGTPLYLKALLRGLFSGPSADPLFRARMEAEAHAVGGDELHRRLAKVDPVAAGRIASGDLRRIVRALEVFEQTGRPISDWQREFGLPTSPAPRVACLWLARPELYRRINERVLAMFAAGWTQEVRLLRERHGRLGREASQAVGYREILGHLEGQGTLEETIACIQQRSRRFAKHQQTWFRHMEEIVRFDVDPAEPADAIVRRLAEFFTNP